MSDNGKLKHYRTCNLCEAMCGIEIIVEEGRIRSIRGDQKDPFSQGHICPKAAALQDLYEDPDRLKRPVKRTATGWKEISWTEAFDTVAAGLKEIQNRHGRDAIGIYLGNPNVHNLGSMLVGSTFNRALKTKNVYSATSVDQLPSHVAARHMFGHFFMLPVPDVDRTDYFLILGANPLVSNGSLMTAGGIKRRMQGIQARGGKIVVLDPIRTATAKMADEHYFVKPGTDVLLLLAMVHTILTDGLVDKMGLLLGQVKGLETVDDLVSSYSPEKVSPHIGLSAEAIRRIAHDFATAPTAVAYGRIGLSIQPFGGLCQWLINLLNLLTGNLDWPGGAMFPHPAVEVHQPYRVGKYGRWQSRVSGYPEYFGELPVAALGEELLTEGEGQIKGMVTVAGNPLLSTPNGRQLEEGFANLDFMVSIDIYINETTRFADIILPPTIGLETDHYDVVFHGLAVRNTAKFSEALFQPEPGTMADWEIFRELAARLAPEAAPFDRNSPLNRMTPAEMIDAALKSGPYELDLQTLKENRHGVDIGPLQVAGRDRLHTKDRLIDAAPEGIISDLARVDATFFNPEEKRDDLIFGYDEYQLVGRRDLRSNNSWMHNASRLMRGKSRCTLQISEEDAAEIGVISGETARVSSRVGVVELPVEVSDDIMPGVVSIPHGWGHNRPDTQLSVAAQRPGVSINDLTDDRLIDHLTGNAALNGVPVTVQKCDPAN